MEEFFAQYAARYTPYKPGGIWCYEDGCIYRGLEALYAATGNGMWREHLLRLIDAQVSSNGELRGYSPEEFNIDNILGGRVLFALGATENDRFMQALRRLAGQLARHPRTPGGNYWHKKIYPDQVWLDGLYMGLPFQMEYGRLTGDAALVDDAVRQLLRATSLMRDPETGLYHHGLDEARRQIWADPDTGLSQSFWARAIGWLAMALVDGADVLDDSHPQRGEILARAAKLGDAILGYRTERGLWLQVMDMPGLGGNYEETSSSAMFAYFLVRLSTLLDSDDRMRYAEAGLQALASLKAHYVTEAADGTWELRQVCEVAGLGTIGGVQRDGTPQYYVREARVANDSKGVGPLMMAEAARMKLLAQTGSAPQSVARG